MLAPTGENGIAGAREQLRTESYGVGKYLTGERMSPGSENSYKIHGFLDSRVNQAHAAGVSWARNPPT